MKENQYILEAANIDQIFNQGKPNEFQALHSINVAIPKGSLAILKGKSGSGKTTLMNILGALDKPTNGRVLLDGQDITSYSDVRREEVRRFQTGFIFQAVSLIPMMTAFENVEFALRLSGYEGDRVKRAEECLKMVGLGARMNHMPSEMSGGEQQRVAIARAISHKPKIIFADEPTAELDSQTSARVVALFKKMVETEDVTILMTTHDTHIMNAGDVIIHLEDGKVIEYLTFDKENAKEGE